MPYEFLEHTADVKFKVEEESLDDAFISCFDALNEVIRGDINILDPEEISIEINANDMPSLLHDFLEEFLYLLDSEGFLASRVKSLEIDPENFVLHALVVGDKADNYKFTNDVKAVTYNELKIEQTENNVLCEVVLDV